MLSSSLPELLGKRDLNVRRDARVPLLKLTVIAFVLTTVFILRWRVVQARQALPVLPAPEIVGVWKSIEGEKIEFEIAPEGDFLLKHDDHRALSGTCTRLKADEIRIHGLLDATSNWLSSSDSSMGFKYTIEGDRLVVSAPSVSSVHLRNKRKDDEPKTKNTNYFPPSGNERLLFERER
jgi:hypothetical protein